MVTKFRLSPMKAIYMSHRPEDKKREKTVRFVEVEDNADAQGTAKKSPHGLRIGPPAKKKEVVDQNPETDKNKVRSADRIKELHLRGKGMPYVDVPPLKANWRSPVSDPIKETQDNRLVPAYKSRAPVELDVDIEKLVESVLDLQISVPLRSLAGVSTAIQKEIKKQVTKARLPIGPTVQNNLQVGRERKFIRASSLPVAMYMIMAEVSDEIPEGFRVASDPILQYLMENKDADPSDLIVAKVSEPLKAVFLKINRLLQEECLLDEGSEIVSMGKLVAIALGLTWNPLLSCTMGSSTNHHEKTLGIARNVRMESGGVAGHFQVHILENPPYRVLLGRPFTVLMSSTLRTRSDGSSELEITDPNTKQVAVIPTYDRGKGPEEMKKLGFQSF